MSKESITLKKYLQLYRGMWRIWEEEMSIDSRELDRCLAIAVRFNSFIRNINLLLLYI